MTRSYDRLGELLTASDAGATDAYTYNRLGQVASITQTIAGLTPIVTLSQQFDTLGGRSLLSTAIGDTADFENGYQYNSLGQMISMGQHGASGGTAGLSSSAVADKAVQFTYTLDGQFATINRFTTSSTLATTFGYDLAGRLTSLVHSQDATVLAGYGWTYDGAGRLTQQTSTADGTVNYSYDATGQLTAAVYSSSSPQSPAPSP